MKKFFAALMALMMLLLPTLSLADGSFLMEAAESGRAIESATTFVAGKGLTGTEAVDKIIDELLSALRVTCYWQSDDGTQMGLRVALDGKEVLTADMAGRDGEVYMTSDLLAGTTLAMKPDESDVVADKMLDLLVRKGLFTQAQADEIRAQAEAAAQAAAGETQNTSATIDYEKMMQGFIDNDEALEALTDWVVEIIGRMEEVDVTGQPENSDTATTALRVTLTAEDLVKGWELTAELLKANEEYMRLLDQTVEQADGAYASGAELLDDVTAALRDRLPAMMKDDAALTLYMADDAPVAVTFDAAFEDETDAAALAMRYTRRTAEDAATHTVGWSFTGTTNGEAFNDAMELAFTARDNALTAVLSATDNDDTITYTLNANWTETTLDAVLDATMDAGTITTALTATKADDGDAHTLNALLTVTDNVDYVMTCTLAADWTDTDAGHTLNGTLTVADTQAAALTFTVNADWAITDAERSATATLGWDFNGVNADLDGTGSLDVTFNEKKTGEHDAEQTLALKLTRNDKHLITIVNESRTVDPYASIVTDDVLRPAEMTDDELDAWFDDVYANLQLWAIKLLQSLPTSVLMLIMGVQ